MRQRGGESALIVRFEITMCSRLSRKERSQRLIELTGILKHCEMAHLWQHDETRARYRK